MERLIQYLDDLDDLYGALGLIYERARRLSLALARLALVAAVAAVAIMLALVHPPIALATSTMLFVILLYRSVTAAPGGWMRPTA